MSTSLTSAAFPAAATIAPATHTLGRRLWTYDFFSQCIGGVRITFPPSVAAGERNNYANNVSSPFMGYK